MIPSNIPSKIASRAENEPSIPEKLGKLMGDAKSASDNLQMQLAGAIFPSFPGQPVGKYFDLAFGIDIHATTFPALPVCPVPTIAIVFDIISAIFGAISDNMAPPPAPADGSAPPFSWKTIVTMMRPSVKANGQWIANAGTPLIHLPAIIIHAFPVTAPMADAEMFMGSSKVLADGTPFSTRFHPALSCNTYGFPDPPKHPGKFKKPKNSLVLPTSILLANFGHGKNRVEAGGPPTIDLFGNLIKLGLKGLGKLWKKLGGDELMDKLKKFLTNKFPLLDNISQKLASIQKKIDCFLFGEPVDAATGRVFAENQDFFLPGPIPINWTRTYYSDAEIKTPLGYNWHHSYNVGYTELEEGFALLRMNDGREVVLPPLITGDNFYHKDEKIYWLRNEKGYAFKKDELTYSFEKEPFEKNQYKKNDFNPVTKIENIYNNQVKFAYDLKGNLEEIIDSCDRKLIILNDEKGFIKSVSLEKPGDFRRFILVSYEHDELGNMTGVINESGKAKKKFYYDEHLLIQLTNQSGWNFYWEYEGKGDDAKCVHTWGDQGLLEYNTVYEEGKTITTDSLGNKTEYHYDENFLIHTIIDAKGGVTRQVYDNKKLSVVISPEGKTSKYIYDEKGNLIKLTDANENSSLFKYDKNNKIENYRSASGKAFNWEYDEEGKLIKRKYPDGTSTEYQYENGKLAEIKDDKKRKTELIWDEHHNLKEAILPNGKKIKWEYDFMGNMLKEILPNKSKQEYIYDNSGQVIELKGSDGNHHHFKYDKAGNVIRAQDNNQTVEFEYWGLGLLKSRTQNGKKVVFNYNTEEQLSGIKNEAGEFYKFIRDSLGNIVGEWGFDGLYRQYVRDGDSKVMRIMRAEKRWTKYDYDDIGNIVNVEFSDGSMQNFTYDSDRLLQQASNDNITVKFIRDKSGRVIEELQNGISVKSTYNKDGNREKLESSLGAEIQNKYDFQGYLEEINTKEGWQAKFERDEMGLELSRFVTGEISSKLERDITGRITSQHIQGKNIEGSKKRYVWSPGDRLKQIINDIDGSVTNFEYDKSGSLLSADYSEIEKIYKMPDSIGNLFKTKERKDRIYDKGGKLIQDETWHYLYDKEGNLILKSKRNIQKLQALNFQNEGEKEKYNNEFDFKAEIRNYTKKEIEEYKTKKQGFSEEKSQHLEWQQGDWEYKWEASGMLKSVRNPEGKLIEFEYDALGRRTAKIVNNQINRYIWDGNVLMHQWQYDLKDRPQLQVNIKGELAYNHEEPLDNLTTWVYEDGSFTPSAKITGDKKYSIISDYLGTPYQAYNEQGKLVWEAELDIYGKVRNLKGNQDFIPFRYQGQYEDQELGGLYYNRFRYYDSNSGLYISQDPIGIKGGFTLYGYVKDVNSWIDIFGLAAKVEPQFPVDATPVSSVPSADDLINRANEVKYARIGTPESIEKYKTASVGYATDSKGKGYLVAASSDNNLSPSQRSSLDLESGELRASGKGHAEMTILDYCEDNDLTLQSVAASRPVCEGCQKRLDNEGVEIVSERKRISNKH